MRFGSFFERPDQPTSLIGGLVWDLTLRSPQQCLLRWRMYDVQLEHLIESSRRAWHNVWKMCECKTCKFECVWVFMLSVYCI